MRHAAKVIHVLFVVKLRTPGVYLVHLHSVFSLTAPDRDLSFAVPTRFLYCEIPSDNPHAAPFGRREAIAIGLEKKHNERTKRCEGC